MVFICFKLCYFCLRHEDCQKYFRKFVSYYNIYRKAMKTILVQLFLFMSLMSFAQKGDVTIIKDSRIDALVAKEGAIEPPAIAPQMDGFRIQLFFDSERSAINDARATFIAKYPRIDTYTTYNAPNFFLRVGDFRTRLEAEKVKEELSDLFPTSFIVAEKINIPRLEKEKRDQ